MQFQIGRRSEFNSAKLNSMHFLRAEVFKYKKGWDVTLLSGMEIDGYDALNPLYLLIDDPCDSQSVMGCWRILPTTGPYMLKDTFPELCEEKIPEAVDVWELSRFAVQTKEPTAMQFSDTSREAIREIVNFGISQKLHSYVTVTTVGVERMLRKLGVKTERLGRPQQIGVENTVALRISLGEETCAALGIEQLLSF